MEEFLLGVFLTRKELYVIDQQSIQRSVVALEFVNGVMLQRLNHIRDEAFRVNVNNFSVTFSLSGQVAGGLHQMGFA